MFENWRKVSTPRAQSVSYPVEISQCRISEQMWVSKGSIAYELRDANGRRIGLKAPYDGFVHPFLAVGQTIDSPAVAFYVVQAEEGSELDSEGRVHHASNADYAPSGDADIAEDDQWEDEELGEELPNGTTLANGQYTIKRYIAAGGFGITYFAEDNLGRSVVIKECFPASISRRRDSRVSAATRDQQPTLKKCIRLFVKEARVLAQLQHPNIVGVKGCFEENGTAYMVLERVHGHDIDWNLEHNRDALTPEFVSFLARTMLDTLAAVHAAGMLHRDVSPGNIMINMDSQPMLIDFGAARAEVTKASRAVSTHPVVKDGYSPNELYISGALQTPATDLYALAGTLYHVITGAVPPAADMRQHMMSNGEADPYVPLAGQYPGHDQALLAAIDKSMALRMADRCQSAAEWLAMMDAKAPEKTKAKPATEKTAKPATEKAAPAKAPSLTAYLATALSRQNSGAVNKTPLVAPELLRDWAMDLCEKAQLFQSKKKVFGVLTPDDFTVVDGKRLELRLDFKPADLSAKVDGTQVPAQHKHYIAPELLAAEVPMSAASDVYTIAAILFACLTGRAPDPAMQRKIPAAMFGPKPVFDAIEAALMPRPAQRPALDEFARSATNLRSREQPRAEEVKADPTPKATPKPTPKAQKVAPKDEVKKPSQDAHPSGPLSWVTLVMTGALIPLAVASVSNIFTFGDPLYSFETLRFFLAETLDVDGDTPWYALALLALCGVIFAQVVRQARKARPVPERRWLPVASAFLLGFQILPILLAEQVYTEAPSNHELLLSVGIGIAFACAAFFLFRPKPAT